MSRLQHWPLGSWLFVPGASAAPIEAPIDITGEVNVNLQTYTGGTNYPIGPATMTVGSIPFNLAGFSPGGRADRFAHGRQGARAGPGEKIVGICVGSDWRDFSNFLGLTMT